MVIFVSICFLVFHTCTCEWSYWNSWLHVVQRFPYELYFLAITSLCIFLILFHMGINLTYRGQVTHICFSKLDHHCCRQKIVACCVWSHYRKQCWLIVNWIIANWWNLKQTTQLTLRKCIWKYFLQNGGHFVAISMSWIMYDLKNGSLYLGNYDKLILPQQKLTSSCVFIDVSFKFVPKAPIDWNILVSD